MCLEHVRLCLKHFSAAHLVRSPPPCGEGSGVGVVRFFCRWRHHYLAASPPSPALPHKGGGSTPSSPLPLIPLQTLHIPPALQNCMAPNRRNRRRAGPLMLLGNTKENLE